MRGNNLLPSQPESLHGSSGTPQIVDARLSQISTSWTLVRDAADPGHPQRIAAQQRLLEVYSRGIRRYLLACLRNQDQVDEVYQTFALKLVRGDFATADPARGRFRSFVKTVLYRLIVDLKRHHKPSQPLASEPMDENVDVADEIADQEFREYWRHNLLSYAWDRLKEVQQTHRGVYYLLLKLRVEYPDWSQSKLIDELQRLTGERVKPGSLRVNLYRARRRFSDYLVEAVSLSLDRDSEDDLEDELAALDLLKYCGEAIKRRKEIANA